jgi:hypothetical protein
MNAWILTAAGNLVNASSVTHVTVKESSDGSVAVGLSASSTPSKIVECANETQALTVRNRLAVALSAIYEVATLISLDAKFNVHAVAM